MLDCVHSKLDSHLLTWWQWQWERQLGCCSGELSDVNSVHVPHSHRTRGDGLRAVVEQKHMRCVIKSELGVHPGSDHCPTALHKCLHYGMVHLIDKSNLVRIL